MRAAASVGLCAVLAVGCLPAVAIAEPADTGQAAADQAQPAPAAETHAAPAAMTAAPAADALVGDGTEQSPYLVGTASQLIEAANKSADGTLVSIKLTGDIDLSQVEPSDGVYIAMFSGTLDGDGHKLYNAAEGSSFINVFKTGAIKNLEWNVDGVCYLVMESGWKTTDVLLYQDITITGEVNYPSENNKNESPLVVYCGGNVTFERVVNEATITSPTYNGIFVGCYPCSGANYVFKGCVNKGDVTGDQIGMFFGNGWEADKCLDPDTGTSTLTITDCSNEGTITSMSASGYIFGVSNPTSGPVKDLCDRLIADNPGLKADNFLVLEANDSFELTKNTDGTLTINRIDDAANVASIRISLSVYARVTAADGTDNGTNTHTVADTIELRDGISSYTTFLSLDRKFYDGSGDLSATGQDASVKLVTAEDGTIYYALCGNGCAGDAQNGEVHTLGKPGNVTSTEPQLISVLLYDANGKLVGKYSKTDIQVGTQNGPSYKVDSPIEVGTKLAGVALPNGLEAWANPNELVVVGGQIAYAVDVNKALVPVFVMGEPRQDVETGFQYDVAADGSVVIAGGLDVVTDDGVLEIPSEIDGKPVSAIAANAFANNPEIKELVVPDSIKSIENSAFAYCDNLSVLRWRGAALASPAAPDDASKVSVDSSAFLGCDASDKQVWLDCDDSGYVHALQDRLGVLGGFVSEDTTWYVAHDKVALHASMLPTEMASGQEVAWCFTCDAAVDSPSDVTATEQRYNTKVPVANTTYLVMVTDAAGKTFYVLNAKATDYDAAFTALAGSDFKLPVTAELEEGFELDGWKVTASADKDLLVGDIIEPGRTLALSGSLSVEAVGKKVDPVEKYWTVTFKSNVPGAADTQVKVKDGEKVAMPADPTLDGWKFAGWFTDETLTSEFDASAPIIADVTLYGGWYEDGPTGKPEGEPTDKPAKPAAGDTVLAATGDTALDAAVPAVLGAAGAALAAAAALGLRRRNN